MLFDTVDAFQQHARRPTPAPWRVESAEDNADLAGRDAWQQAKHALACKEHRQPGRRFDWTATATECAASQERVAAGDVTACPPRHLIEPDHVRCKKPRQPQNGDAAEWAMIHLIEQPKAAPPPDPWPADSRPPWWQAFAEALRQWVHAVNKRLEFPEDLDDPEIEAEIVAGLQAEAIGVFGWPGLPRPTAKELARFVVSGMTSRCQSDTSEGACYTGLKDRNFPRRNAADRGGHGDKDMLTPVGLSRPAFFCGL